MPITCLNLERCIGEAYEESVVRGYEFHQLPPKAQGRKRKGRWKRSSAVENASPCLREHLSVFSQTTQIPSSR